jgi:rhodanese-related sulfurtransferase
MSKKMIVAGVLILIAALFITFKNVQAQAHVESKAFDLMLSTLLAHDVKEISVIDVTSDTTIIYLDAREKAEYDVSHIKNAIWVGYDTFNAAEIDNFDKEATYIVYCSVGYRSEKITHQLEVNGFLFVTNLYGGIFEWVNQGKPVYDNAGNQTTKVHAYSSKWGVWLNEGEKVYE